jgi:hypothetical protein
MTDSFSERHGYNQPPDHNFIYEDASERLRQYIITVILEEMNQNAHFLRSMICASLSFRPDPDNWSEGNVYQEAERLMHEVQWYEVYDIIETCARHFAQQNYRLSDKFTEHINRGFTRFGIGWILQDGLVQTRGDDVFQSVKAEAIGTLEENGFSRANRELKEAFADLSRRPEPDLTGTITHSVGALESVAKDLCGEPKLTLGEILKKHPDLMPTPIVAAVEKLWGYSSDVARHIREDRNVLREEAQFVLGISASLISYLMEKNQKNF